MPKSEAYKVLLLKEKFERVLKRLQPEIGEIAVKHYRKSFDLEGFNNIPFMHWTPLKRERKRYKNRKILTQTGKLKKSLYYKSRVGKATWSVDVKSDLVYAQIHNEGLMGLAFGKYPFKMPKRRFIGYSKVLDNKIQTRINNRINSEMK